VRWVKIAAAVLGALVVAAAVAASLTIGPRNLIGMLLYDQRREGDLKVGDRAPDVPLVSLDGSTGARLADHMDGKPLILIFGSYT
jgi:hypothetical protein